MARKDADLATNPESAKSAGPAPVDALAPEGGQVEVERGEWQGMSFIERTISPRAQMRLECLKLAQAMRPSGQFSQIDAICHDAARLLGWVLEIPPAEADPDWLAGLNREIAGWREIEPRLKRLDDDFEQLIADLRRDGLPS